MKLLALLALLLLIAGSGCASGHYSFFNASHVGKHFTCIYRDFHELHKDIDYCIFGIGEEEHDTSDSFDVKTGVK